MSRLEPPKPIVVKHWALIFWPAFVSACLLEALVFSLIDPSELHWSGYLPQLSRLGAYTIAFFCFWIICIVCSGLTLWLAGPGNRVRRQESR